MKQPQKTAAQTGILLAAFLGLILIECSCSAPPAPRPRTTPPPSTMIIPPSTAPIIAVDEYAQALIYGLGAPNAFRGAGAGPEHVIPHVPARLTYAVDPAIASVAQAAARNVEDCTRGAVVLTRVNAALPHVIPIQFSPEENGAAGLCHPRVGSDGFLEGGATVFYYGGRWYDEASLTHELGHCALGFWHSIDPDDRMGGTPRGGAFSDRECAAWRAAAMLPPGPPAWAGPRTSSARAVPEAIP